MERPEPRGRWVRSALAGLLLFTTLIAEPAEIAADAVGPNLAKGPDGTVLLSYIKNDDASAKLVYHDVSGSQPDVARVVASGDNWFINWADFPSVVPLSATRRAAHWLVRQPVGGYAYDIHVSVSEDAGGQWSDPFLLHDDDTPTEHGFVTLFPFDDAVGAVWLDGRNMAGAGHGSHGTEGGMSLRAARFDASREVSEGAEIDDLTCDCCQTDVAYFDDELVVVYRDRSDHEIRDVSVVRYSGKRWLKPVRVHEDGWKISGCPVNGPVASTHEDTLVVAWFTAANDRPLIRLAWSDDRAATFSGPITIASEGVTGYVGAALLDSNTAVVSWMCSSELAAATICYRWVDRDGALGPALHLADAAITARMSVPQLENVGDELLFVWTERDIDGYSIHGQRIDHAAVRRSSTP